MLTFAEFQEDALYGPRGFFTARSRSGPSGDFITSSTLGGAFAEVIARVVDEYWQELGCPDPFDVVEFGAGDGSLARSILQRDLQCSPALRYTLIDKVPIKVEGACFAHELPDNVVDCVVLANELFDNMPVRLFEWQADKWMEVCVAITDDGVAREVLAQCPGEFAKILHTLVPDPPVDARVPLQFELLNWLEDSRRIANGRLLAFDYARSTQEMANMPQASWLRTYRGHHPGGDPLQSPGWQDITCDVAIDQVQLRFPEIEVVSQAEFLEHHGINEFPRAETTGVMEALRARAKKLEVEALLDPSGLGGFTVFKWRWCGSHQRQKNT